MIHIIKTKVTTQQLDEMLKELAPIIIDIRLGILAGSGQMHADCEAALIEDGSQQEDIWGANWIPATQTLEFEALINLRPKQQNYAMSIQNPEIKHQIERISKLLLESA